MGGEKPAPAPSPKDITPTAPTGSESKSPEQGRYSDLFKGLKVNFGKLPEAPRPGQSGDLGQQIQGAKAPAEPPTTEPPERRIPSGFGYSNPAYEAQAAAYRKRFERVPLSTAVKAASEVQMNLNAGELAAINPATLTAREAIHWREEMLWRTPDYNNLDAANRALLDQIDTRLENLVDQAKLKTRFRSLEAEIGRVYAEIDAGRRGGMRGPEASTYGGRSPDVARREGFKAIMEEVRFREEQIADTDPELIGALGYVVKRAFGRIQDSITGETRLDYREDPGGPLDTDPAIIGRRRSVEREWEWSLKEAEERASWEAQDRLATGRFFGRYSSYYLTFDYATTLPELRKGVEQWLESHETGGEVKYQVILRDLELLHTLIMDRGQALGMTKDEAEGFVEELEQRAFSLLGSDFAKKVPLDSMEGFKNIAEQWVYPHRRRLRRGVRAYEAKMALSADLLHHGVHRDGTEYVEYYRPDKQTFVQIMDKSEFFRRQEEVKRKQLSRMARMELRQKDDVWRTRMVSILINRPHIAQTLIPNPAERDPALLRNLGRHSWRLETIEAQYIMADLIAQAQNPNPNALVYPNLQQASVQLYLGGLLQRLQEGRGLTREQGQLYEAFQTGLKNQLIGAFNVGPGAIANAEARALATAYGLERFFDEYAFEEQVDPVDAKFRRPGNTGGRAALQGPQDLAWFELGQWMVIRRMGPETIDLVGRDQLPEERLELWTEKAYDRRLREGLDLILSYQTAPPPGQQNQGIDQARAQELQTDFATAWPNVAVTPFEIMKRLAALRRGAAFTLTEEKLFKDLLVDALNRETRGGVRPLTQTDIENPNARRADKQQLTRLRQAQDMLLGELMLIKYEHAGLRRLRNVWVGDELNRNVQPNAQVALMRKVVPSFDEADKSFRFCEDTLNLTGIATQYGQPVLRLDNAPANAPVRKDGVRKGCDLVPVEETERLVAWYMKNNEQQVVITVNGKQRSLMHPHNPQQPLRWKDLHYWNLRLTYLKTFLDFSLLGDKDRFHPTIFTEQEILNLCLTDQERRQAREDLEDKNVKDKEDMYRARRERAVLYTQRVGALMRAYEQEADTVLTQLDTQGVGTSFAWPTAQGAPQPPPRSFESIKRDRDLVPVINFGIAEVAQTGADYFFSEELGLAAHDPNHPYYHTYGAKARRVLEDRYGGPLAQTRTEEGGAYEDIYKRMESERREYVGLMSIVWRHFYDPQATTSQRVEMGLYTQPYGLKRVHYWLPFFNYDKGLMHYGREILPFIDSQVRGLALDHGYDGLMDYLGGAVEGNDPRVFLGWDGQMPDGSSWVDDQDAGRHLKRELAADAGRANFFGRAIKTPQGERKTRVFHKWINNIYRNFSKYYSKVTDIPYVITDSTDKTEALLGAFFDANERVFTAAETWDFLQDRTMLKESEVFAYTWFILHAWKYAIEVASQDRRYSGAKPYLEAYYALLPYRSRHVRNPTDPVTWRDAPNVMQAAYGERVF